MMKRWIHKMHGLKGFIQYGCYPIYLSCALCHQNKGMVLQKLVYSKKKKKTITWTLSLKCLCFWLYLLFLTMFCLVFFYMFMLLLRVIKSCIILWQFLWVCISAGVLTDFNTQSLWFSAKSCSGVSLWEVTRSILVCVCALPPPFPSFLRLYMKNDPCTTKQLNVFSALIWWRWAHHSHPLPPLLCTSINFVCVCWANICAR